MASTGNSIFFADEKKEDDGVHPADAGEDKHLAETSTVVETVTATGKFLIDVNKVSFGSEEENVDVRSGFELNIGAFSQSDKDEVSAKGLVSTGDNGSGNYHEEVDIDKSKYADHVYGVGDLVWGKIKSHPWWPGQIYDSKDASDFAVKHGQEGRILVAFFGDGSCSWCLPSFLVPFVENFHEMSKDSTSKSFLNAVNLAVDQVRRVLETDMMCNCISMEIRDSISRPVVQNAGVRPGVLVPEVDVRRLSIPKYEPNEVLSRLVHFAKNASSGSALEAGVLSGWLSAFYRSKGIVCLPVYVESIPIEGLEDISSDNGENQGTEDLSVPTDAPLLGPRDDDWSSLPENAKAAGDVVYQRRKQKSVSEIMADSVCVSPKRQKISSNKDDIDVDKFKSSGKRKESYAKQAEKGGSDRGSRGGKSRGKKKAKDDASPLISDEKGSVASSKGDGLTDENSKRRQSKSEDGTFEETSGEAIEESENASTPPRERKKSKYLSPPFTEPISRVGSSSFKKRSDTAVKAMVKLEGQKALGRVPESGDGVLKENDAPMVTSPNMACNEGKGLSFSVSDVDVPVHEVLSGIQRATVDPLYLSKNGSLETVWGFISALRSSTYRRGLDYTGFRKFIAGKNGKTLASEPEKLEKGSDQKSTKAVMGKRMPDSSSKTSKAKKRLENSETSKSKEDAEISLANHPNESAAPSALVIKFTPGFPLPSKEEIVNVYGKFGTLEEKETEVFGDSRSARIVYKEYSNAESAFKSSVIESPFGVGNVQDYWLSHSLAQTTHRHLAPPDISRGDAISDVKLIMHNLEITVGILEKHHSKFSDDDKAHLKEEVKNLTEQVELVSERVRVMAENTSS